MLPCICLYLDSETSAESFSFLLIRAGLGRFGVGFWVGCGIARVGVSHRGYFPGTPFLTRDEVRNLIYSLISIRETLTMGNTWTSSYDFNFTYAYDSKGVETASTVERKKNRVAKLIEDYPEYKGLTTLEEILKADAKRLATAFFEEANIKGKALSKQPRTHRVGKKTGRTSVQDGEGDHAAEYDLREGSS